MVFVKQLSFSHYEVRTLFTWDVSIAGKHELHQRYIVRLERLDAFFSSPATAGDRAQQRDRLRQGREGREDRAGEGCDFEGNGGVVGLPDGRGV